jgi:hypothetical protein
MSPARGKEDFMRMLTATVLLCGLASPAFAECVDSATIDCNAADVLPQPLPGQENAPLGQLNLNAPIKPGDPSLYEDPAMAPSDPIMDAEPANETPDIDPYTLAPPPE